MRQRIFRRLTVALLVASFCGNNSFALEDSSAVPAERDVCMKEFVPLRTEAEERGNQIKAASARHAPPGEACELIGRFGQSEIRMIKFIDANSTRCGFPQQVADHLGAGHSNTEAMQRKVCAMAQAHPGGPAGPVGDFDHIGAPPLIR